MDKANRSLYDFFEGDLKVSLQPVLRSGAQESWLGKWCGPKIDHTAVINLELSDREQIIIWEKD